MAFISINPFDGEQLFKLDFDSKKTIYSKIELLDTVFVVWRKTSIEYRKRLLSKLSENLLAEKLELAETASLEMGKPIFEAIAEIEKCAWLCNYYVENIERFLKLKQIQTDAHQSFVTYEPLGIILGIMPWNFPYWQVFRFIVPTLMAGNTIALKHAPNVGMCAHKIQELLNKSGFPTEVYQNLFIDTKEIEDLLLDNRIKAVSLTGSLKAGESVAQLAGKNIKKCVLELGGSCAFIVLEDADIEKAVEGAILGRFLNSGQSCIAAKRILVHKKIYSDFETKFLEKVKELKSGNPLDSTTSIGPIARIDLALLLEEQIQDSIKLGANILLGGKRNGAMFEPTVITNVSTDMSVFKEELFGPCAVLLKFETIEEAIDISNKSEFGLGVSVYTKNPKKYLNYISDFDEGGVFFNSIVKSDPRLPFGGIKKSGYGRELSEEGIKEFVNVKTIYVS